MKSQEEMVKNLTNDKYLLGSKLANIQERTSKPLGSKNEVEEKEENTNPIINTVKKEVNPAEEQNTKTPYRHPNYKHPFDQQQGQNEHTERRDKVRRSRTSNQNTKQQTRRPIPQSDQIASKKNIFGMDHIIDDATVLLGNS